MTGQVIAQSTITCPSCGTEKIETMPTNACQFFYECAGCSVMFIDPRAFNANEPGPPHSSGAQQAAAPPTMSLDTYSRTSAEPAASPEPDGKTRVS